MNQIADYYISLLEDKQLVIHWLIDGYGQAPHMSNLKWLTMDYIKNNYNYEN